MDYLEAETNLFVGASRDELIRGGYDSTRSSKFCLTLPPGFGHCTWIPSGIENFNFPLRILLMPSVPTVVSEPLVQSKIGLNTFLMLICMRYMSNFQFLNCS